MKKEQTCCVTGHRDIPVDRIDVIREKLREEILEAVSAGYTHFICGFAVGIDLMFAVIVADLKKEYPITLEAAIPNPGRMKMLNEHFYEIIKECDVVKTHSDHYFKGCFMVRNRYMVDRSSLVIAVHDDRKTGGTAATIKYAKASGRIVKEVRL